MTKIIDWTHHIGRRLRLRDLHVFFAVVQSGSMSKAAANLRVSHPAVSQIIADLEGTLGVKLFDRSARGVVPTIYGRALLARAQAAFDELKQGIQEIEFLSEPNTGELKLGCPEALAPLLPPVIESFSRQFPGIVLDIYDEEFATGAAKLHDRKLDLVIQRLHGHPRPGDPYFDGLDVEILFDDDVVVVAGMQTRWAKRRKIDLAELANEPWILASPPSWNHGVVLEAYRALGLGLPRIVLSTYSTHIRINMVASGRFIATFPRSIAQFYADRFSLKILPIQLPARPWPVGILTLKNRTLSPVVGRFIEHIRQFATLPHAGSIVRRSTT